MSKYIAGIFMLWSVIYLLSFAKYNLGKKNKYAAAGGIVLAIFVIVLPLMLLFME